MKANEVKLADLLTGTVQYRVPLFQRPYSWEDEEWEQLWKDLAEVYGSDDSESHFIGAVVTSPVPDAPERAGKFLLIDGQQRLTTVLVMLKSLVDVATDSENEFVVEQINRHLWNHAKFPDDKPKLRPTEDDRSGFAMVLSGDDGDSRFHRAYRFFRARYDEGDEQGQPFDLDRLVTAVLSRMELVSVRLETNDSPHRIFESLNSKGMALTAADLIRNHVFMRLANDETRQELIFSRLWQPMEQELGKNFTDFFWRYLMMDGSLPAWDQIFTAFQAMFRDIRDDDLEDFLEDVRGHAAAYKRIVEPEDAETNDEVRQRMERINRWELDTSYPLLLKLYRARANGAVADDAVIGILDSLESFAVRRSVCGVPTNRMRRIFARLAAKFDSSKALEQCRTHLVENDWPTNGRFHEDFQTFTAYLRSRLARSRLVLERLERTFEGKEKVVVGDDATIEHVMPQTLDDAWEQALGPDAEVVHEKWLHTIGNLTLSAYNSELGNRPFSEKRDILKDSGFAMNRSLAETESWNLTSISRRAQELADLAVGVWAYSEVD